MPSLDRLQPLCTSRAIRCTSSSVLRVTARPRLDSSANTGDISSTSNLCRQAIRCWGDEAVAAADKTTNARIAREALSNKEPNRSITAAFEGVGKGRVTYSHRQHTKAEARYIPFSLPSAKLTHILNVLGPNSFAGWLRTSDLFKLSMIVRSVPS